MSSLIRTENTQTSVTSLPPGFVRLRYFFGKRLGVADFFDEQTYHSAKDRFHNTQLHGAGIVCGLAVSPYYGPDMAGQTPAATPASDSDSNELSVYASTLLRVGRGAALDELGREIVVGYDQCIDTNAWFQVQQKSAGPGWPFPVDLDSAGRLVTYAVLSYKECPTDPEPAPRDVCNVATGGAEFGRVREEFCLEFVTRSLVSALAPNLVPSLTAIDTAIQRPSPSATWEALIEGITSPDSVNRANRGLVIGKVLLCLTSTSSGAQAVNALALDGKFVPPVLFSTSLLQELLRRLVERDGGAGSNGPQITSAAYALNNVSSSDAPSGEEHNLTVSLYLDGTIVAASLEAGQFMLWALDPVTGWSKVDIKPAVEYDPVGNRIQVTWPVSSAGVFSFRMVEDAPPIIDQGMNVLGPTDYRYQFNTETSN